MARESNGEAAKKEEPAIVKQLRTLATTGVQRPTAVAEELHKLDELCTVLGLTAWQEENAVSVAKRICDAVLTSVDRLKREWPAETEIEKADRDEALRALDATFGLGEFEKYERITHRREAFDEEPGSSAKVRAFTRGIERKVLSRLADLLVSERAIDLDIDSADATERTTASSSESGTTTGLEVLQDLQYFFTRLHDNVSHDDYYTIDHDKMLLSFADFYISGLHRNIYFVYSVTDFLIGAVIDDKAEGDKAIVDRLVFGRYWPDFPRREKELLAAAVDSASGNGHTFLEYLESRKLGKRILKEWLEWVNCTSGFSNCEDDMCPINCSLRTYECLIAFCEARFPVPLSGLDVMFDSDHA